MHATAPKKIVLLGIMSKYPVPGVIWQVMHYLVGFKRLGHEPYYVEAHACSPSAFMQPGGLDGSGKAAAFIDSVMRRFDLAGRWAYQALHADNRCYGMEQHQLNDLYASADLIINLHGATVPLPEHIAGGRLVYLETDPVELQVELHNNLQQSIDFLSHHRAFFTFAENYGRPGCGLPVSDRFTFRPTRQPVVLDFWQAPMNGVASPFTTIGNWRQPQRTVVFNGQKYHWSKHYEFLKFIDLPRRIGQPLELALSTVSDADRQMLEGHGWRVRNALDFSSDTDGYRHYIQHSRGEFTVAKDQNVRLRSGWFSDRSATYLAAGRPVITQDTGFGNVLPTGRGLFAFSTMDDILAAIDCINSDYPANCRAAAEIAREYFSAEVILRRLLDDVAA
jgi:hypothetical protein